MSEIHQQLKEKIQELETIRKVREHTKQLQTRLVLEEKDLAIMEKTLEKEQRDIETLEKEGLTTMFHKFLGDREEKLEKEREEYLKASLRFNELYKSVELIRFELDLLSKKEQNLESVQGQVEVLIQQREEELMKNDPAVARELQGIHEQTDKLHKYSVEVDEAYNAGQIAFGYVHKAEHYLHEAQNWGQRDMWGGRYHGTGHMKHQAIDHAREMAHQSKHALIKFGNELRDVYNNLQLQVNMEIEKFGRFADVFFDNLITDWMVQQKINKSLANVSATRRQLEMVLQQLDQERATIKGKLEQLEKSRKQTIITSDS